MNRSFYSDLAEECKNEKEIAKITQIPLAVISLDIKLEGMKIIMKYSKL